MAWGDFPVFKRGVGSVEIMQIRVLNNCPLKNMILYWDHKKKIFVNLDGSYGMLPWVEDGKTFPSVSRLTRVESKLRQEIEKRNKHICQLREQIKNLKIQLKKKPIHRDILPLPPDSLRKEAYLEVYKAFSDAFGGVPQSIRRRIYTNYVNRLISKNSGRGCRGIWIPDNNPPPSWDNAVRLIEDQPSKSEGTEVDMPES